MIGMTKGKGYIPILTDLLKILNRSSLIATVQGYDKKFKAKLLGNSFEGTQDFPKLDLGKVEDMNIGDWVVAIGKLATRMLGPIK